MKRHLFTALAIFTFGVAACGDDDDTDPDGNAGKGSSAAGSPSTGDAGGPSGTAGAPSNNVGCDPEADTVCQNAMDCPFVESGQARMAAGSCGTACLTAQSEDPNCTVDCMLDEMGLEMSNECAGCYGDTTLCGIMNCASECLGQTESEECQGCLAEAGCRAAFDECSGLPPQ